MVELADWQLGFVEKYLADNMARTRLVMNPGMGKTTVAQYLASEVLRLKRNENLLVISPYRLMVDQWRQANRNGLSFVDNVEALHEASGSGLSVSAQQLLEPELGSTLLELAEAKSLFRRS